MRLPIAFLGVIALCIAMAVPAQEPIATSASAPAAAVECPAQHTPSPAYPMAAMKHDQRGTAIVSVALDGCGRVVDARIAKGSGYKLLDDAALESVRSSVLGPPGAADKVVDGRREISVRFDMTSALPDTPPLTKATPAQIGWPGTHAHPRYVADSPDEFASVAAAEKVARSGTSHSYEGPYPGLGGVFLATGSQARPEFWWLAELSEWNRIAVRYRPIIENGEAVVHMLLVCDDGPSRCSRNRHVLMKGLPFAAAK